MTNPPDNTVANQVLQMIAQQQRDMHKENTDNRGNDRRLLEQVSEDVNEIKMDFALLNRDVAEIKTWRASVVDPHINATSRAVAISSGAIKERVKNFGVATLIVGMIWTLFAKFGGAVSIALSKVLN